MKDKIEFKPVFEGQKEKLSNQIEYLKIIIRKPLFEEYGIEEELLVKKLSEEMEILEANGLLGLYYLISKSIDDIGVVLPMEITMMGSGNSSIICNLLKFSGGLGAIKRIANIINGVYCSEIFYGPSDARLSANPTNIRFSTFVYTKFIDAFLDNLKTAQNWDSYKEFDLRDFDTQRKLGLFFVADDLLDKLAYMSISYPGSVHDLIEDNDETLDLICHRDTLNREYEFRVLSDNCYDVISEVNPNNKDELSYAVAISTILSKPNHMITHIDSNLVKYNGRNFDGSLMKVFVEDYQKRYIKGGQGDKFLKQKKLCVMNQIFSKAHIDRMVDNEFLFASLYLRKTELTSPCVQIYRPDIIDDLF